MAYNYQSARQIVNNSTTYQSYANPTSGSYAASGWITKTSDTTSTNFSGLTKLGLSSNGVYQLAISSTANTLYLSMDNGVTWTNIYNRSGLPGSGSFSTGSISADGKYILVGVSGGYMYLSSNSGLTFANVNTNTPYAYYPFDGNLTDSKGNVTLTATGSPGYVTGIVGTNAINISNTAGSTSNQYVRGTIPALTNFSLSGWFNMQTAPGSNGRSNIITIGSPSQTFFNLFYLNASLINSITYTGFTVTFINSGNTEYVIANQPAISTNTWYNFNVIFQPSGTCYAYLNGVLIGTSTGQVLLNTISSISLGAWTHASSALAFNGYIDDLKIYNSAIGFTPTNSIYSAVSGTGQYMAVAVASGGLFMSANYGSTWSQVTSVIGTGAWSSLALSHTGQYMLANGGGMTSPNMTGLTGSTSVLNASTTWTANGITWTSSASTVLTVNYNSWIAFDNIYNRSTSPYSWASAGNYNSSGTANTTTNIIVGIGSVYGEWLQIQSSIPLSMYSYAFGAGGGINNTPKIYYIVGSNDGSNWYPIQYVSIGTNPCTTAYNSRTSFVTVNQSGTQTITADVSSTFTITTYSTTTNSYTYFRLIINTTFGTTPSCTELNEWFINFVGGQSYSTNYGANWLSSIYNTYVPNMTGLTGSTSVSNATTSWKTPNGVTWTSSASSANSANFNAWVAFDNIYNTTTAPYSYASPTNYSGSGVYNNTYNMNILGVGTIYGEWLQLQSSIPLIMYSYAFGGAGAPNNMPKIYYIAGSNDGSNWYPIQYVSIGTNPCTTPYNSKTSFITVNQSGTQTVTADVSSTFTITTYSTTTNSYTYFRIIALLTFTGANFELNEWFINFVSNTSTQINSTIATPNCLALSANGQYAIGAAKNTLISNLQFEGGYTDSAGGLTNTTGVATNLSFSSSIYKVGSQSLFCNNTAGSATPSYANYTLPSSLYSPSSITISLWVYPTANPVSSQSCPLGFNNGTTTPGSYFQILSTGICGFAFYTPTIGSSVTSIAAITLNTWSHLTATFSNGVVTFYLNGIQQSSTTITGNLSLNGGANVTNMFVGALETSSGAAPFGYAGYVDDVRIYSRSLTATEVTTLYTTTNLSSTYIVSNYLGGFGTNSYSIANYVQYGDIVAAACSNTGAVMVLITSGTTNNVYYSLNYGSTWTALTIGTVALTGCAVNYDGSYITVSNATNIYTLNSNIIGNSVSLGVGAGQINQGYNTVAIGTNAGQTNQTANSIILNASGSALNSYTSGFYVAPIATALASTSQSFALLGYGADNQVVQSGLSFSTTPQTIYGEWVQLQLATAVSITSYSLQGRLGLTIRFPAAFALVGSNDATYWTILDTQVGAAIGTYTLKSASAVYSYFRVIFTQVSSAAGAYGLVDIGGFILYNNSNSIFGPNANYTIAASGLYNQLQLNSVTVCTVTISWPNIGNSSAAYANSFGIYADNVAGVNQPIALLPTTDGYLKGSAYMVGFGVVNGPTYEYNSSFVAIQGTSTVGYYSVLNGNVQVSGTYSSYNSGLLNITNTSNTPLTCFSVLGPNASNAPVTMMIGQSATQYNSFYLSYMHVGGGSTYNYLGINPYGNGSLGLNIAASGNVGIGITNPAYALDVNGSARAGAYIPLITASASVPVWYTNTPFTNNTWNGPNGTSSMYLVYACMRTSSLYNAVAYVVPATGTIMSVYAYICSFSFSGTTLSFTQNLQYVGGTYVTYSFAVYALF